MCFSSDLVCNDHCDLAFLFTNHILRRTARMYSRCTMHPIQNLHWIPLLPCFVIGIANRSQHLRCKIHSTYLSWVDFLHWCVYLSCTNHATAHNTAIVMRPLTIIDGIQGVWCASQYDGQHILKNTYRIVDTHLHFGAGCLCLRRVDICDRAFSAVIMQASPTGACTSIMSMYCVTQFVYSRSLH